MFKIQKIKIIIVVCLLLLSAIPIFAAEISFDAKIKEIAVGERFEVGIFLNTEEEYINAVEGKVIFPKDLLELKEIRDGNSIINFWVDKPRIDTNINTNKHEIAFGGITPGGYLGKKGLVFSMILKTKKEGEAEISIHDVKTFLNDGRGTETKTIGKNLLVSISADISVPSWVSPQDTEPPEDFKPEIASDPEIFEGKYFLVFATQDKGAGIDHYAIHESTRKKDATRIDTKKWTGAESPYVLKDQGLRSYIYVKAIDKAGNKRIATLSPQNPLKWYENYLIWIIIIVVIIITYFIKRILWKK